MRDYILPATILVGVALLGVAIWISAVQSVKWQTFAKAHNCKVIKKTEGYTGYGFGPNGEMNSFYVSGTTTYRCNDGVEYTR